MTLNPVAAEAQEGIVFAFRFDETGQARQVPRQEPVEIDRTAEGFLWVHLNLADGRGRSRVDAANVLPADARATLLGANDRQHLDYGGGFIWGMFPDFRIDFDRPTSDIGYLRFAIGDHHLISGRRHALQSVENARNALVTGRLTPDPAQLFELLLDNVATAISQTLGEHMSALDVTEDHVLESEPRDDRRHLAPVRRAAVRLDRMIANTHGMLRRFEHQRGHELPEGLRQCAHRIALRFEELHHEIHTITQRARLLDDEVNSKLAAQTGDSVYALSVMTALFLPATLVTGIFGMNTDGLPFKDSPMGTWLAIGLCCASAAMIFLVLRMRGVLGRRKGG